MHLGKEGKAIYMCKITVLLGSELTKAKSKQEYGYCLVPPKLYAFNQKHCQYWR